MAKIVSALRITLDYPDSLTWSKPLGATDKMVSLIRSIHSSLGYQAVKVKRVRNNLILAELANQIQYS